MNLDDRATPDAFEARREEKAATIILPEKPDDESLTPLARVLAGGALELDDAQEVPEPSWSCPVCRGRGWRIAADGGSGSAERCDCVLKRDRGQTQQALIFSGMARGEIECAYKPWDENHQPKPSFAREWLSWVLTGADGEIMPPHLTPDNVPPAEPWILTLFGKPGRGKTKTTATLMRIFSEGGGRKPTWAHYSRAFDRVQRERKELGFSPWEDRIIEAGLLAIDEYGASHRVDAEKIDDTVNFWISQRFRAQLPTVINTNARSFDELRESRIASRVGAGIYREMKAATDYRDRR